MREQKLIARARTGKRPTLLCLVCGLHILTLETGDPHELDFEKTLLAVIATLALAAPSFARATEGGANGGGGGLVVRNGQLKLLTEAGLRVQGSTTETLPEYYEVTPALNGAIQQVTALISRDPKMQQFIGNFVNGFFGSQTTYIVANSVDPTLEKKIRAEYSEVATRFGMSVPSQTITLAAWSDSNHTYILPNFAKLSLLQQAKVMIHEGLYRHLLGQTFVQDQLRRVMAVDTQIEAMIKAQQAGQSFDRLPLILALDNALNPEINTQYLQRAPDQDEDLEQAKFLAALTRIQNARRGPIELRELLSEDTLKYVQDFRDRLNRDYLLKYAMNDSIALYSIDPIAVQKLAGRDQVARTILGTITASRYHLTLVSNIDDAIGEHYKGGGGKKYAKRAEALFASRIQPICTSTGYAGQNVDFMWVDSSKDQVYAINCAQNSLFQLRRKY